MTVLALAGPMTGYPYKNYPAFNEAQNRLEEAGFKVISPLEADKFVAKNDPEPSQEWFRRTCLRLMLTAEHLAVLDGWEKSVGARLEVEVAACIGMHVKTVKDWCDLRAE